MRRATFCPEHDWCHSPSLAFHLSHFTKPSWPNSSKPCHFWGTFDLKGRNYTKYVVILYLYPPSIARTCETCPFENESSPWVGDNKCQHPTTLPCLTSLKKYPKKSRTKVQIFPSLEGFFRILFVSKSMGKSCHFAVFFWAALAFQPVIEKTRSWASRFGFSNLSRKHRIICIMALMSQNVCTTHLILKVSENLCRVQELQGIFVKNLSKTKKTFNPDSFSKSTWCLSYVLTLATSA